MPELLENVGGYTLRNLNRVNIILGKNGCGKSTLLRGIENSLSSNHRETYGVTSYITPERGGFLLYDSGQEQNIISNTNHILDTRRRNQHTNFKQQSVVQYRALKELVQDEIEKIQEIRDSDITFDSYLEKINVLLDNIKVVRERRSFTIAKKSNDAPIGPDQISSGESELIALGIECLKFSKEVEPLKNNILFLDEPDVHLHPDLQSKLVQFIKGLVEENLHFQVVIATHSTAILGAFAESDLVSIGFMRSGDNDITLRPITDYHKRILPVFGAHPLSEVFNNKPILLVEGEDDVRIWQQAARTSNGRVKIYPISTDSIDELINYEREVDRIISAVYDEAIGYSLRDRDNESEAINDEGTVIRFRLSCRNAENLILTNEVLTNLRIDWATVQQRIQDWIDNPVNNGRADYATMVSFRDEGFQRKTFDLKYVRNVLIYLAASNKPWEVVVGQSIGNLTWNDATDFRAEGSLINFLGEKLVRNIIPKSV